ncbi:MAG: helix-turn-helix domain-containing protein [Caldilineaceae bacterium]
MTTKQPLTFGQWLKRQRRKLGLTQAELARRAYCAVYTIRRFENGVRHPSLQMAQALATALEIPEPERARFLELALAPSLQAVEEETESVNGVRKPLPGLLKPLLGRTQELATLLDWLRTGEARLITLTGMGGSGKSHLLLALAHAARPALPGELYWVDLEPLNHSHAGLPQTTVELDELLFRAIGAALSLDPQKQPALDEQITRHLASRPSCLYLDGFDSFTPCTAAVTRLLTACPTLTIVLTTRQRLGVSYERLFPLNGLAVPITADAADLESVGAVALFLAAAKRCIPGFTLTDQNRPAVVALCQQVEGLPLALELAALHLEHCTPTELVADLAASLALLKTEASDLPLRQRSLAQLLTMAFDTASPAIQQTLIQLAVFAGIFDAAAAEAVTACALPCLQALVALSWLKPNGSGGYRLHPLVRTFGRELGQTPAWASWQAETVVAYAHYYAQLVGRTVAWSTQFDRTFVAHIQSHYADMVQAATILLDQAPPAAVNLLLALVCHGYHYGALRAVVDLLRAGLAALAPPHPARARLLLFYVPCMIELGEECSIASAELAEWAPQIQDQRLLAEVHHRLAWNANNDYAALTPAHRQAGQEHFAQSLALYRALGDTAMVIELLHDSAFVAAWEPERHAHARDQLMEALWLIQRHGLFNHQFMVHKTLAFLEYAAGHFADAEVYSEQALRLAATAQQHQRDLAWLLHERGEIAFYTSGVATAQAYETQARLYFAADGLRKGLATSDARLGYYALHLAAPDTAETAWAQAQAGAAQLDDMKIMTEALIGLGLVMLLRGQWTAGASLVTRGRTTYEQRCFHWIAPEQTRVQWMLDQAATRLAAQAGKVR